MYNHSFNNFNDTSGYRNGYDAGVDTRNNQSHHQSHTSNHDHGHVQKTEFADLKGARASSADSELRRRGFHDVDSFKSGQTAYSIWYKRSTGQCLQNTVAQGRVVDISDIQTNPACH
jgi:hypothetical protein